MSVLAIELNDAGIRAARADDAGLVAVDGEHRESAGFAWMRQDEIVTGRKAWDQARRHPLGVDDRFWDQLDVQPVDARDPHSPSRAEVAFEHLRRVVEQVRRPDEEVVIAVPPFYDRRQLGLLVSIARELKIPLRGLVASPVALPPELVPSGTFMVVALGLQRCTMSIMVNGEHLRHERTYVSPDVGLLAFWRQWVKAVGGEFVRKTRFDPLHNADTEQQLHDKLFAILDRDDFGAGERLELDVGTRVHRVTVTDQTLAHAGHGLVLEVCGDAQQAMAAYAPTEALVTYDAAWAPGLERTLQRQLSVPVRALPAGASALGLAQLWPDHFETIDADGVAYHPRRLIGETTPPAAESAVATS